MTDKIIAAVAAFIFTAGIVSTSHAQVRGCDYPRTKCVSQADDLKPNQQFAGGDSEPFNG